MSKLEDLKKAKAFSDARQYEQKHLIMRTMMETDPSEFEIDSEVDGIVGIVHTPTGFQMHLPSHVVANLNVAKKNAALKAWSPGKGMAHFNGGGQGTYSKMKTLGSQLKSDLTNATKDVGEEAKVKSPWAIQYPATYAHYSGEFLNKNKGGPKVASFSADVPKYLGYTPGFWYDENDVQGKDRMRAGNLIAGAGLSGVGLASIPLLQYLFPERFEGKGTALTIAALAGGMTLPWLANLPHTANELSSLGMPSNANYGAEESAKFIADFRDAVYKKSEENNDVSTTFSKVQSYPKAFTEKKAWGDEQYEEDVFLSGFNFANKEEAVLAINKLQELAANKNVDLSFSGQAAPYASMTPEEAIKSINNAKLDNFKYDNLKNMIGKDGGYLEANLPWFYRFTLKNSNMPHDVLNELSYSEILSLLSEKNEKKAFLPLGTPISKMHLADVAAEQFQAGMIDYGQAAGLMRAASQASAQPWFTVRDLARAAIGAGAGAIAGTAAAKGIGTFMNISPTEQRIMQGTGAALGTLINLGKFGL